MTSPKPKRQGNYKPGPGRPKGSKNKKTLALEAAAREAMEGVEGSFEGDAHAFLQSVYKNPEVPIEVRIVAATKALRVEKPALSAIGAKLHADLLAQAFEPITMIELIPGTKDITPISKD
jgi:hypothetical protein